MNKIAEVEILNIRLPKDIIKWIDSLIDKGIYDSRSEMIRNFIREYIMEKTT